MRKIVTVTAALGLAIGSAMIVQAAGASAAAPTTDLAATGSVAGGLRILGETGHVVAFTFDLKNKCPDGVTSSSTRPARPVRRRAGVRAHRHGRQAVSANRSPAVCTLCA